MLGIIALDLSALDAPGLRHDARIYGDLELHRGPTRVGLALLAPDSDSFRLKGFTRNFAEVPIRVGRKVAPMMAADLVAPGRYGMWASLLRTYFEN